MRNRVLVIAVGLVVGACSSATSTPSFVEDRPPSTTDCAPSQPVFLPVGQGPDEYEEASTAALACILHASETKLSAELHFTLLGTEGEHYDAYLLTLTDGTTNYYRENVNGWTGSEGCTDLTWPAPGAPLVSECAKHYP